MTFGTRERGNIHGDESGLTMVELMVYSVLLVVVLVAVGQIFLSSLRTESSVRTVVDATTAAQLGASSVETGIRNSSAHRITSVTGGDQLLQARVAKGEAVLTWVCAAWYFDYSATGVSQIRYHEYPETTVAMTVPTASQVANWTLLVDGVKPSTGTSIFGGSGSSLTLAYEVVAGDGQPPASISTTAYRRAPSPGSGTCY